MRRVSRITQMRRSLRAEAGLTLVDVAKRLPGRRWSQRTDKEKRNRVAYLARIERNGTACHKMAVRLGRLYRCSPYLFLPAGANEFATSKTDLRSLA